MLLEAKKLPYITLHSIPESRRTNFFFYDNPQPVKKIIIFLYKEYEILRRKPPAYPHHLSEILRRADPLLFCKTEGSFQGYPR